MNKLPKYWAVQLTEENQELFRKTVIPYMLNVYEEYWRGDGIGYFYGYDGNRLYKGTNYCKNIEAFKNSPTILSLSEFIELSKEVEEFVLPEKWAVKRDMDTYNILNEWCNSHPGVQGTNSSKGYVHSHNYGYYWVGYQNGYYYANSNLKHPDHTEITFDQFKQYVLKTKEEVIQYTLDELVDNHSVVVYIDSKKDWGKLEATKKFKMTSEYWGKCCYSLSKGIHSSSSNSKNSGSFKNVKIITVKDIKFNDKAMEKQIIGYKLKKDCQQYKEAAIKITNNSSLFQYTREFHGYDFSTESQVKIDLEKAGVLTLWFEPVYKEEYKYKVGDWVVVLPEDGFYHNCEQGCAQQIVDIDFNRRLPYRLRFSDKSCNTYSKIRLATPEEIKKAITKELPIGKYTAIIKDGKITTLKLYNYVLYRLFK